MNRKYYLDEIWKDIKGYEGLYKISNYGRIMTSVFYGEHKWTMLHITAYNHNYKKVRLVDKDGKSRYFRVHRLVAMNFLPKPTCKQTQVEHIDCNRQNNYVKCRIVNGIIVVDEDGSNLRWTTPKGNMCNEITRQRISISKTNPSPETRKRMSEAQKRRFQRERETHTGRYAKIMQ